MIADVSFEGHGCAISTASASLMTEAVKGKTGRRGEALFRDFHALLTARWRRRRARPRQAAVLAGVREFPVRVKCATLAWHTLHNALSGAGLTARTE